MVTDPKWGLADWRGASTVPAGRLRQTLVRFFERIAPHEMAEAVVRVQRHAANLLPEALETVAEVMRGGPEEAEDVDAAVLGVRLKASSYLLDRAGYGVKEASGVGVAVGVEVNVGTDHRKRQEAARAIIAARRVEARVRDADADEA